MSVSVSVPLTLSLTLANPHPSPNAKPVPGPNEVNPASPLGNALAFFICGLPGGVDYGMLAAVKVGPTLTLTLTLTLVLWLADP